DYHDLTPNGGGDSHKYEVVNPLNLSFYASQARSVSGINGIDVVRYGGNTNRYLKFETAPSGNVTRIIEYRNAGYQGAPIGTRDLQSKNGLIYINGNVFVQGEIKGKVTVVSSQNVYYTGNVKYAGNQSYVNPNDSVAFLARNKQFFLPTSLEVSGILYAEKSSSGNLALNAAYQSGTSANGHQPIYDAGASKLLGHFRHYGNIVMNGVANTSVYQYDRAYVYDPNLKYYRPPGLPVEPDIRLVREAPNP
ncbi:MAG: hypothetical protein HY351_04850, partial [Candidatus Omnitrophica bacterium]|nr:hypothetical protein [Candidatus Omnitrophota bacterium]